MAIDKQTYALAKKYTDSQLIEAGDVTGVKGDAEEEYRAGKVNITPANVGTYSSAQIDTLLGDKVDKVEGKGLSTEDYTTAEKTKLEGIAEGATKVEASTTNGNIKIDGTETQVYDDSDIKQELSTDTATETGNPINFTTLSAQKAVSTQLTMAPIQEGSGTPSPSNVRAISGRTDATITVKDEDNVTQNTVTISFGQTVYGGALDVESGTLTVYREILDLGDLTPRTVFSDSHIAIYELPDRAYGQDVDFTSICSSYDFYGYGISTELINNLANGQYGFQTTVNFMRIRDDRFSTQEEFETGMAGVKIVYYLAIPITIQLTPNEISLLEGVNNISSTADGITLTYRSGKVATLGDLNSTNASIEANASVIQLILANFAPIEQTTATEGHSIGDYLVWDGVLVKVIDTIAAGDTLVLDTNVEKTTVADMLA